jgi:hypothetical protein
MQAPGAGKRVARSDDMSPKPVSRPTGQQPPVERHTQQPPAEQHTGISNRESAAEEQAERQAHPPVDPGPPPPEDAAGRVGDAETATFDGGQTSHKAGSRSVAQKEDEARYPDRSMPPTRKSSGAFGKEPQD